MILPKTECARCVLHADDFSKPDGIAALPASFFVTPDEGMTVRRIKGLYVGLARGILARIKEVICVCKILFFYRTF